MSITRRDFLLLLGSSASTVVLYSLAGCDKKVAVQPTTPEVKAAFAFQPIKGPIPLETAGFRPEQQKEQYSSYEVQDDLVLPQGYQYQVIAAWGDKLGDSRFGYNNDYLSLIPTGENEGYLSVNFEYISAIPWMQTYEQVIGKSLPFDEVKAALKENKSGKNEINAFSLPDSNPIKAKIREICKEALLDQGLGVMSIRKTADGKWERTNSKADRRISGISGLEDGRYLKATGPAVVVFRKQQGLGYVDKLGDRIIGSYGNCAGGTTPWGTVLSAEENFQAQVPEPVYADGTSFDPSKQPFALGDEELFGQGNVFGLAGNKYGWIVEVDPANPNDYGTKHTWLGRYHHEAVGVRTEAGKPLAFYSGCDRRGGHIYKFVSRDIVNDPKDKANSRLLSQGMLYVAKFNPDGTGRWIPLKADTPINPDLPSTIAGNVIRLPKGPTKAQDKGGQAFQPLPARVEGGDFEITKDEQITQYKQKFKKLGDLYIGNPEEQQGAILIDAHYAANAAGGTCTARPEDTEIAPNGNLYISFTSGSPDDEGGPDIRVFKGPKNETPYEYGWVMRLVEDANEPTANSFQWQMVATGGEPSVGGLGFANPDNLLLDNNGNIWMVTDMSTSKMNQAVKSRTNDKGKPASLSGLFGNNALWYIPTNGDDALKAFLFGIGPMECETTGPCFAPDQQTMFLSIQHPGETNGIRKNQASETREFLITTTTGEEFLQSRQIPVGSNWPSKKPDDSPKPAVVAVWKSPAT
ncbi:alkaline phosphatase PhoX [Brasilonema sp. UFV-L1]|uniref:PhoX family protein n=1 Tax=Brasilonema sp. UFV-L1 TaxID=2234130 RepID=UPI00145F9C71|nr:alkaline phosphatase PhoX [Brasilonema sp. UFV-L1]NMG07062.1 phosphatase [Brasilonema sp. UFV-L1]